MENVRPIQPTALDTPRPTRSRAKRTPDPATITATLASGFPLANELEADDCAEAFARYAIGSQLRTIIDHESSARIGHDPEGIHQMRAAGRRLRTYVAHLDDVLDPKWSSVMRSELRWLGRSLGQVRDLDVMRDVLAACAASLPAAEVHQLEPLFATIATQRTLAHHALCEDFDDERFSELMVSATNAVHDPPILDGVHADAATLCRSITSTAWDRLNDAVEQLGATPSDGALHHVRRRAKRARFASELAVPIIDAPARKLAKSLANVQNVLGVQHDAVVAHQWVKNHAHGESADVNFAAGMVAGLLRNAAQAAAREFPVAWQRASRKKLRAWL